MPCGVVGLVSSCIECNVTSRRNKSHLLCHESVPVDTGLTHTNRTRNNHLPSDAAVRRSLCTHKTTGKNQSAWFLPSRIRIVGRL